MSQYRKTICATCGNLKAINKSYVVCRGCMDHEPANKGVQALCLHGLTKAGMAA